MKRGVLIMTTRRQILMRFAAVTGTAGAYSAMRALGLAGSDVAFAAMPDLAPDSGKGVRVVILGAGVAGLSAAYELGKAGYECTILEARDRTGGRNFTVRKGTAIEMTDGSRQVCSFDDGYYFNAGPARIPSHHTTTLGYCRDFGIAMETEVNWSGSALIQSDTLNGGKPIQMRQAKFDYQGQVAELLAKCTIKGALDDVFTAEDRDKLIASLGQWGGLAKDLTYQGDIRAGFDVYPAAGPIVGKARTPLPLALTEHPMVSFTAGFADLIEMQATMQQPVGGMDRIPAAFEARLGNVIRKGCEVRRIRRVGKGVEIYYYDKLTHEVETVKADYCICTIPLPVLAGIKSDFSKERKAAIARNTVYGDGYKIAFQSPRFWERNDQIYGGLSFTDRDTFLTWYPSAGFHQPEGIIVAGYAFNGKMGERSWEEQVAYARGTIDRLHPGQSGQMKTPIAIQWSKMQYSLGLESEMPEKDVSAYTLLSEPDGPFYLAGEHLSHVGAWQQGAFDSAHRVVGQIAARQRSLKS
jgi:monoamine oxidase